MAPPGSVGWFVFKEEHRDDASPNSVDVLHSHLDEQLAAELYAQLNDLRPQRK